MMKKALLGALICSCAMPAMADITRTYTDNPKGEKELQSVLVAKLTDDGFRFEVNGLPNAFNFYTSDRKKSHAGKVQKMRFLNPAGKLNANGDFGTIEFYYYGGKTVVDGTVSTKSFEYNGKTYTVTKRESLMSKYYNNMCTYEINTIKVSDVCDIGITFNSGDYFTEDELDIAFGFSMEDDFKLDNLDQINSYQSAQVMALILNQDKTQIEALVKLIEGNPELQKRHEKLLVELKNYSKYADHQKQKGDSGNDILLGLMNAVKASQENTPLAPINALTTTEAGWTAEEIREMVFDISTELEEERAKRRSKR
ncbi:hypothetical protein VST7929_01403 [Vibrio stylophorae]|uniref:Rap-GAP domain-containing protein n=1 Tax=Vibrio stylophorae TaxID=659351 RepID=A0ABM8ZT86_9VIBR|nr:hypothetical protein [Vibrio stylophorae]CAH0533533.1 hypothetical protein VST7929_01403 [Vibrio stylophorae]